ncbi:SAV_2336 N-terminal domain-related protein [Streptomyces sp. ME02-8801-2C]|uniref:SAV_2336 N-terminal domain-related protein n=1 Tax=Streptomyces sp. ME02-8801-2C TaxID=3028680 RepID=UPI0029B0A6A3|nr:SAV_2336 N-terminal domain-related protein [Streptomyces sp. ME02-8801-2C]MDX3451036.1 SAV_2336 N-terminal domain-related protein [Streptomyces sp. ME02-8801-2C]
MRPNATELADALWLAGRMADADTGAGNGPGVGAPDGTQAGREGVSADPADHPAPPQLLAVVRARGGPRQPGDRREQGLEQAGKPERTGRPESQEGTDGQEGPDDPEEPAGAAETYDAPGAEILVPTASAFPDLLSLARALRPLRDWQRLTGAPRPRSDDLLDESLTAQASAAGNCALPVFRADRRRRARMQLLVDDSPSMGAWDRTLEELRLACEQSGAFRSVTVHRLRPHPDGGVGVLCRAGGSQWLAPAEGLRDPSGRTLTLLLSDCSGPLWRHGAGQRFLHRRLRAGPLAVVQPLPARLWPQTLLATEPGTLRCTTDPGGTLGFEPFRAPRPRHDEALPVPVLPPTPAALGDWARLLSERSAGTPVASVAMVGPADEGTPPGPRPDRSPAQLVEDFRTVASPAARRLAVCFSAAPLAYPVMQLVQRALLPATGPVELAEVLFSDLLVEVAEERDGPGPWYEFAPGVRDLLLRRLELDEARAVLQQCSRYLGRVWGEKAQNFPATVVAHLSGAAVHAVVATDGSEETAGRPVPQPFADVPRRVLRRFQPREVEGAANLVINRSHSQSLALWLARSRLARYERQGGIRDLWDAVRLLRATTPTPATRALLAECLLGLWDIHRDRAVLREAEDTVRAAADPAGAPPAHAHLVLGKVLRARAATEPDDGTRARALAEAAESLERAYALVRSEPRPLLDVLLCVVDVVRARYRLLGDRRLLYGAQVRLDALLEGWPGEHPLPGSALLARGALLMELCANARERDSADEARALAVQASADFESAAGLAERAGEARGVVCRAWLELAAARAVVVGDEGAREVLGALGEALRVAGDTGELRLRALWRLAVAHTARWTRTAEAAELETADGYFASAQAQLSTDDPRRPELLTARGGALLDRAGHGGDVDVATDAVRVLRAALAQTSESAPALPARRLLFARALHRHHELGGSLTDLHEAEWILARAARGARSGGDSRTEALAWLERGDVLRSLADPQHATTQYEDRAAESYGRAAAAAADETSVDLLVMARALHRRAMVLERTAGPARALDAYRAAWATWQRAGGDARHPEARTTLERMRALSVRAMGTASA